jgi:hypothetical protein
MFGGLVIRLLPYLLVAGLVAGGVWKWNEMEKTILRQKTEINNWETAYSVMESNMYLERELAKDAQKKAVFQAVADAKKNMIEGGMNYDTSTTVDVNSTNFYLSY